MAGSVLPLIARRPTVTKDRISTPPSRSWARFEATSLRAITAAAGVNLASVNHHFGSKEELFQAVLTRPRSDEPGASRPPDEARAWSDRRPVVRSHPVGDVRAGLAARADPERGGKNFRLLGRAYADPAPSSVASWPSNTR
jgi:hypothetical protein